MNEKLAFTALFVKTVLLRIISHVLRSQPPRPRPWPPSRLPAPADRELSEPPSRSRAGSKFCETFPRECAVNVSERRLIELTPQVWKTIVSVNQRVNSTIKP